MDFLGTADRTRQPDREHERPLLSLMDTVLASQRNAAKDNYGKQRLVRRQECSEALVEIPARPEQALRNVDRINHAGCE